MYSENFMVLFDHLVQATISFYEIQEVHDGITPKSFAINTTIFSFYTSIDKKSASCSFFFLGGFFCCVGGGVAVFGQLKTHNSLILTVFM